MKTEDFKVEIALAIAERTIRRFWITCIILILLLAGSNAYWYHREQQFEVVTTTETVESYLECDGDAICVVGKDNSVNGGKNQSKSNTDHNKKSKKVQR